MTKKLKSINPITEIESDFLKKEILESNGTELTNFIKHEEGKEYNACRFRLKNFNIEYRTSKITPTKTGQFVTIWKRTHDGLTAPFDAFDNIDFIIVRCEFETRFGHFIFPKSILIEKGIISQKGQGGKRGIRVYPSWNSTESKQALKTQQWQNQFFFESLMLDESKTKLFLKSLNKKSPRIIQGILFLFTLEFTYSQQSFY